MTFFFTLGSQGASDFPAVNLGQDEIRQLRTKRTQEREKKRKTFICKTTRKQRKIKAAQKSSEHTACRFFIHSGTLMSILAERRLLVCGRWNIPHYFVSLNCSVQSQTSSSIQEHLSTVGVFLNRTCCSLFTNVKHKTVSL